MPEAGTGTGAGQQGTGQTDPKGTQAGGQGATGDPAEDEDEDEDPVAQALDAKAAAKLRKEAAARRVQLREAQAKIAELEANGLSELDAAKKAAKDAEARATKLEAKVKAKTLGVEVRDLAAGMGIGNTKLAARLIDMDEVEWDDDDEPTNVAKLLRALLKEMPELKTGQGGASQGGGADGGAGRRSNQAAGSGINDQLRAMTGRGVVN